MGAKAKSDDFDMLGDGSCIDMWFDIVGGGGAHGPLRLQRVDYMDICDMETIWKIGYGKDIIWKYNMI